MKCAIVTGANGFIGSWLVNELLERNIKVYAVIRNGSQLRSSIINSINLHVIECDLCNYKQLVKLIHENSIDVFYHFAWEGSSGELRANYYVQLNNIKYTVDAVKIAKELNCLLFCGAGSIMEQEANYFVPTDKVKPNLSYIYSTAKLTSHYMAKTMAANLGLPFIWGVISNTYGVGENSPRFINTTIRKLINGNELSLTEGKQFYDFVYISDLVNAFYLLGEYGIPYTSYYIGSSSPMELRKYVGLIRDVINPYFSLSFGGIPYNGPYLPANIFDTTKLMMDTGYKPKIDFKKGILLTSEWLKRTEEI